MAELYRVDNIFTLPASNKAMKFREHYLPEYFTATFYFADNDGIKVTKQNVKQFKVWSCELLMRVTKAGSVDIVKMSVLGATKYSGHSIDLLAGKTKEKDPSEYATIQARHFNQLQDYRVRIMSQAVQACVSSHEVKVDKNGNISYTIGGIGKKLSDAELEAIDKDITESSYSKLDGSFYQELAERYKKVILEGDLTPVKSLQALYYPDKSHTRVQAYLTEARKLGLLPKAPKGKNSPIRKTRKKG